MIPLTKEACERYDMTPPPPQPTAKRSRKQGKEKPSKFADAIAKKATCWKHGREQPEDSNAALEPTEPLPPSKGKWLVQEHGKCNTRNLGTWKDEWNRLRFSALFFFASLSMGSQVYHQSPIVYPNHHSRGWYTQSNEAIQICGSGLFFDMCHFSLRVSHYDETKLRTEAKISILLKSEPCSYLGHCSTSKLQRLPPQMYSNFW